MDTTRFDSVARLFGSGMTRREALRGLVAGAAALTAGGALLQTEDAAAKRRRKKGKKGKKGSTQAPGDQPQTGQPESGQPQTGQPLLAPGTRCESTTQCTAGYICEVPVNGSNSDRYCSGGPGAICGAPNGDGDDTAPFCAVGHRCVFNLNAGNNYTCQAVPDEI